MGWIEPKVDWTAEDYFNATDYNRIIGNLTHLRTILSGLFSGLTEISLGEEKTYLSGIYASELNNIEKSLEKLNTETYHLLIGEKKTYEPNQRTPLWSDYNRIESALLLIYKAVEAHEKTLPRLAFTLGSQKGIRV